MARRGIGILASSKATGRTRKIMVPPEQEKPVRFSRRATDYSLLDHLGILFFVFLIICLNEQNLSLHTHDCHSEHNFKLFKLSSHHKTSHNNIATLINFMRLFPESFYWCIIDLTMWLSSERDLLKLESRLQVC